MTDLDPSICEVHIWIGEENRPKLELDEHDAGGLRCDAGDKAKSERVAP